MKKRVQPLIVLMLVFGALLWNGCAFAQALDASAAALPAFLEGMEWFPSMEDVPSARVKIQLAEDEPYLFLPSCADLSRLALFFPCDALTARGAAEGEISLANGVPFDLTALFPQGEPADGDYPLGVTDSQGRTATLHIMRSARQAALWLVSDDPAEHGREWVDSAEVEAKLSATGSLAALDEAGNVLYNGGLRELRGRGNTTWSHSPKKPYQIKLEEKTDLLQNGNDNTARTWVLLAEAYDGTLLHNTVSLALGEALGLAGTPECRPVDLYYDGEYRGYYLLCEKVQVNKARLDILDYASVLEENASDIDNREAYPLAEGQNDYGNAYQYAEGLESGERRAFLVELDKFSYRNDEGWFITYDASTGLENPFSFKDPNVVPQEDAAYVSGLLQELLDCAVNEGVNPITGMTLEEYVDLDSLARYLLVHQIAKTVDLGETSVNFYLPEDSELLYPGPIWDFDIAYGIRETQNQASTAEGYMPCEGWMRELMKYPALQEKMQELFFVELEPLITGVLLADGEAASGSLLSLTGYENRIQASYRMNAKLWKRVTTDVLYPELSENIAYLRTYLTQRCEWLHNDMALWFGAQVDRVGLRWGGGETASAVNPFPHYTISAVETAMEADGGKAVTITLQADEGIIFGDGLTATVNGKEAEVALTSESECQVLWTE